MTLSNHICTFQLNVKVLNEVEWKTVLHVKFKIFHVTHFAPH